MSFVNLFSFLMPFIGAETPPTTTTSMSFSDGMTEFLTFITNLMTAWGKVITVILTAGNWILILPVFAYVFVIATSSLRSMYKG